MKQDLITKRQQWREQMERDREESKARMAKEHGLERNNKFELAYSIAWSHGHSSGIQEVEMYFEELAELLKP